MFRFSMTFTTVFTTVFTMVFTMAVLLQATIAHAQTVQSRAPLMASGYATSVQTLPSGGFVTSGPAVKLGSATTQNGVTSYRLGQTTVARQPESRRVAYYAPVAQQVAPANSLVAPQGNIVTNNDGWQKVERKVVVGNTVNPCHMTYPTSYEVAPSNQGYSTSAYPTHGYVLPANTIPTLAPTVQYRQYKPVVPLRSAVPNGAYVSQGMFGQPKAYVQGQGVRNFFRYVLP